MKKFSKITLLLLLLVVSLLVATSCKDDPNIVDIPKSGSISIADDGMPQLVYVRGEDIDLTNGILSINTGDEIKEIALNSEGVTISGYDKNKVGEQVVTITYGEHSTQITVTVVERMQAIEFVTDYLAGDAFDLTKGRLKITRNDGTNYTVILSNDKVTLSGFDSKTASKQTVTAKYDSGDGVYECQFDVTVHAVENVKFNAPKKLAYKSHESDIDLTGATFTLTGKGGELVREVAVTKDMISGFDLSAVTEEKSEVTQTIAVKYAEKTYNYDITLIYTDISLFKKNAASFAEIKIEIEELPEISETLGELSLRMMDIYLELSKADRAYITSEECLNTARVALMYGFGLMDDEFASMEKAFTISEGDLYLVCESPEAIEKAKELLENYDNDIYRVTPILSGIVVDLADEEVVEGVTFSDFGVIEMENYEILVDLFDYMLNLHEKFERIPADWKSVGVNAYASHIENAYNFILSSEYRSTSFLELYYHVSNWRADKDAFDILYTYYYGQNDMDSLKVLSGILLPDKLQELSTYIFDAIAQIDSIENGMQVDTSAFLYNYHMSLKLADDIKASDNQMIKDLYETLPVNAAFGFDESVPFYFDNMLEYLKTMEGGFYQFSGGLLGIDKYHNLMNKYMEIVFRLSIDDENLTYEKSEEYGQDVEEMFAMYIDLTPTQQFSFLGALNAYYGMNLPPLAFDDSGEWEGFTCFFVNIINDYYRSKFTETAVPVYNDLVIAIEIYAQRFTSETWVEDFTNRMDSIAAAYSKMEGDDKVAFERYLKATYDKYALIRNRFVDSTEKTELGDWADEFQALKEAVMKTELAYTLIEQGDMDVYGMFFSAFERAQKISAYILANASQDVIDAYYYEAIYSLDDVLADGSTEEEGTESDTEETEIVYVSLDYIMSTYRTVYINYQLTLIDGGGLYYIYTDGKLADFYSKAYFLTWEFLFCDDNPDTPEFDPTYTVFDKTIVMEALNMFRDLTLDEKFLFTMMEGESSYYYYALDAFLQETCTDSAAAVATKLIGIEQLMIVYESSPTAENFEEIKTDLASLKDAYSKLSGEDKTSFEPFEAMYTYYVELCETIIAESETNAQ